MRTIVVLGCGPSLTQADVDYCRGKAEVMAVNDAYRLAPWADWMYAADVSWWGMHHAAVKTGFAGECWTQSEQAAEWYGLRHISSVDEPGLSLDPLVINQNGNSGAQAMNLAYHLGAQRIILLGFDLCGTHFHGSHPAPLNDPIALSFQVWQKGFHALAEGLAWQGIKVVNCSRHTKLTGFTRGALETTL
jgi:hypothetical protein